MTIVPQSTLLPPNATDLERAVDSVMATRIAGVSTPLRALWDPATCPENELDALAWALSIDQWDRAWPLATRRARVASAIAVQRRKGTLDAVRRVVRSFGGQITIREWWQASPVGEPFTFDLTLALPSNNDLAPSAAFIDAVISEISDAKPLRSHFSFVVSQNAHGFIGLRGVARPVIYARLAKRAPAAGA